MRHLCSKTTVLSCHRCLINTVTEKMNNKMRILATRCIQVKENVGIQTTAFIFKAHFCIGDIENNLIESKIHW